MIIEELDSDYIQDLIDERLLGTFLATCAQLYLLRADDKEGLPAPREKYLSAMANWRNLRTEVVRRGLLDDAFNLN